jgi:hypothetical protein
LLARDTRSGAIAGDELFFGHLAILSVDPDIAVLESVDDFDVLVITVDVRTGPDLHGRIP